MVSVVLLEFDSSPVVIVQGLCMFHLFRQVPDLATMLEPSTRPCWFLALKWSGVAVTASWGRGAYQENGMEVGLRVGFFPTLFSSSV